MSSPKQFLPAPSLELAGYWGEVTFGIQPKAFLQKPVKAGPKEGYLVLI